jgi:hypothetical protein
VPNFTDEASQGRWPLERSLETEGGRQHRQLVFYVLASFRPPAMAPKFPSQQVCIWDTMLKHFCLNGLQEG